MSKTPKIAPPAEETETPKGILVGYARVSSRDQSERRQVDELIRYGVDARDIWTDNASGKNMKRPGWQGLWRDIRAGDTVVVLALDRLGRNLVEVVTTVDAMRDRGVGLKVLNGDIDTSTPVGRLMLGIFASLAEYERTLIVERSQHGLDKARERGVIGGRKPTLTADVLDDAIKRVNGGETQQQVADSLKVHRNSLAKAMTKRRNALRYEKGAKA